MRIAYLSMHPAPYRDEFLARLKESGKLEIDALTLFSDDKYHRYWNLESQRYRVAPLAEWTDSWLKLLFILLRRLVFAKKYDFVMWPGYGNKAVIGAVLMSAITGKKYGLMADSVSQGHISKIAMIIKRYIVKHALVIFVPGDAGRRFFMTEFNIPSTAIVTGGYALDGESIENRILELRKHRNIIRGDLSLPIDGNVFLMVANMTKNRHYPLTASAFCKFAQKSTNSVFVMVGNGDDYNVIQTMAKDNQCLRPMPGCSFDDMLKLYASADVYVHGGKEPASTALVIGAIGRLPLISSSKVGCAVDVVHDGESGFIVNDYLAENDWVDGFSKMMENQYRWVDMGRTARELSRTLDVGNVISRFEGKMQDLKGSLGLT